MEGREIVVWNCWVVLVNTRYFLKGPPPAFYQVLAKDIFLEDDKYSEWVKALVAWLQQGGEYQCTLFAISICMVILLVEGGDGCQVPLLRFPVQGITLKRSGPRTCRSSMNPGPLNQRKSNKARSLPLLSKDMWGFGVCVGCGFQNHDHHSFMGHQFGHVLLDTKCPYAKCQTNPKLAVPMTICQEEAKVQVFLPEHNMR